MSTVDPVIAALVALCQSEGGHKIVAEEARVSPDNLWQIINGTLLPSGKPRGVGPDVRRRFLAAGSMAPVQLVTPRPVPTVRQLRPDEQLDQAKP